MRKVKKVFAALLLLFVTNTLMAQSETYTLKGSLKDANDGAMMPYTNCCATSFDRQRVCLWRDERRHGRILLQRH